MAPRAQWHESPNIVREVNRRICGQALDGENRGLIALLKAQAGAALPVSVGCGAGIHEMTIVREGLVSHFDLFDVSADALRRGQDIAAEWGIADNMHFFHEDAFERHFVDQYDMVYWHHPLHHMFDAEAAVRWSRTVLKPGGWFVMSDFVGANRFQANCSIISCG